MQRHEVANNAVLCELHRELDGVLEAHARRATRALRLVLKLALRQTFDELRAHGDDPERVPEQVLEAFIEEMAFELALHADGVDTDELTHEFSALVAARLARPAVAA
jgi:Fe-S-cluster formation regulator IscX/YfhJ